MMRVVLLASLLVFATADPRPKNDGGQSQNGLVDEKAQDRVTTYPQNDETAVKDNQFASSQVVENPVYDPALYQSFIPQDAVQQYVSQFGNPYSSYSGIYPNPGAFAVQTGYEGYLVPAAPEPEDSTSLISTGFSFLQSFLTRSFIGWVSRAASYLVSAFGVVLFGGAMTTALCTFTPLCTITFAAFPFLQLKDTAENITKTIGSEITPDRVRRTAELVKEAIEKYSEMQKEFAATHNTNIQKIGKETVNSDL